jgi:hypothetical protein
LGLVSNAKQAINAPQLVLVIVESENFLVESKVVVIKHLQAIMPSIKLQLMDALMVSTQHKDLTLVWNAQLVIIVIQRLKQHVHQEHMPSQVQKHALPAPTDMAVLLQ